MVIDSLFALELLHFFSGHRFLFTVAQRGVICDNLGLNHRYWLESSRFFRLWSLSFPFGFLISFTFWSISRLVYVCHKFIVFQDSQISFYDATTDKSELYVTVGLLFQEGLVVESLIDHFLSQAEISELVNLDTFPVAVPTSYPDYNPRVERGRFFFLVLVFVFFHRLVSCLVIKIGCDLIILVLVFIFACFNGCVFVLNIVLDRDFFCCSGRFNSNRFIYFHFLLLLLSCSSFERTKWVLVYFIDSKESRIDERKRIFCGANLSVISL